MAGDGKRDFDWIDDAFDDKRSEERFGKPSGMKAVGCAVVAAAAIITAIACIALFSGIIAMAAAEVR